MKTGEAVREALVTTIKVFQDYPYSFLYERDIQAFLHGQLWSRLDVLQDLPTEKKFVSRFGGSGRITTHPVKLEWPLQDAYGRIDVAILSKDLWTDERLPWNQRVECAIEIKLWSDPKGMQYFDGLRADYHKLAAYFEGVEGLGIATLFIHPHGAEEEAEIKRMEADVASPLVLIDELPFLSHGMFAFVVTSREGRVGAKTFQLQGIAS